MAAPTPVSAYLHSATMVKAGVFLLVRLWPALGGTDVWFWVLVTVGLGTFTLGAFYAIFEQDLRGLLAYSTISHLRSEEHTSELQSLMRISYAVFCLKKKKNHTHLQNN